MQPIEIGDLSLSDGFQTKQEQLFQAIRKKIVSGLWCKAGKLPSTRKLAEELKVSRNTVTLAYEHLTAEGYIESRKGAGFYVALELPEVFVPAHQTRQDISAMRPPLEVNSPFAPGVPDLVQFPYAQWHKLLQRHGNRALLLGNQEVQGNHELRVALANYLSSSRSVDCNPERIIITSGAQQALTIALMATLSHSDTVMYEQPGYTQLRKIVELFGYQQQPIKVTERAGIEIDQVVSSDAKLLYITPSNQYPMGTTLNTEQRLRLIQWANDRGSWIIEDDYDSEFQFAHRPYTSLQGLAAQIKQKSRVLYVGSLSKVMFNSLRLGYLVVPEHLVSQCLVIKDALSGDSPAHTQAALADYIAEGGLIRHIRKMRRLYKSKHQEMLRCIDFYFGRGLEVISQAAGLHVTVKWQDGIDECSWADKCRKHGIIIRPLSYYETAPFKSRDWSGAVFGFGNVALEEIEPKMQRLAHLFFEQN